jgi:hypothetical protein
MAIETGIGMLRFLREQGIRLEAATWLGAREMKIVVGV